MTQLLVPMTYAEQLEQELIQVTAQRDRMLAAIVDAIGEAHLKFPSENQCFVQIPLAQFDNMENAVSPQE